MRKETKTQITKKLNKNLIQLFLTLKTLQSSKLDGDLSRVEIVSDAILLSNVIVFPSEDLKFVSRSQKSMYGTAVTAATRQNMTRNFISKDDFNMSSIQDIKEM